MHVSAIYTAASEMLGGGEAIKQHCRRPEIMADAAYAILTSDSRIYTGNFDIDEDVLRRNGVTDFQTYSYYEGGYTKYDTICKYLKSVQKLTGSQIKPHISTVSI